MIKTQKHNWSVLFLITALCVQALCFSAVNAQAVCTITENEVSGTLTANTGSQPLFSPNAVTVDIGSCENFDCKAQYSVDYQLSSTEYFSFSSERADGDQIGGWSIESDDGPCYMYTIISPATMWNVYFDTEGKAPGDYTVDFIAKFEKNDTVKAEVVFPLRITVIENTSTGSSGLGTDILNIGVTNEIWAVAPKEGYSPYPAKRRLVIPDPLVLSDQATLTDISINNMHLVNITQDENGAPVPSGGKVNYALFEDDGDPVLATTNYSAPVTLIVEYTPSYETGTHYAAIQASGSYKLNGVNTDFSGDNIVYLKGVTKAAPDFQITETGRTNTFTGQGVNTTYTITNNGSKKLFINGISIIEDTDSHFSITGGVPSEVISGDSEDVIVHYDASTEGIHTATLKMEYEYDGVPYEDAFSHKYLFGKQTLSPRDADLTVSDVNLFAYEDAPDPVTHICTLRNNEPYAIEISSITSSSSGFTIVSGGESGTLGGGESRQIGIEYDDGGPSDTATLTVAYTYFGVSKTATFTDHLVGTTISRDTFAQSPELYLIKNDYFAGDATCPTKIAALCDELNNDPVLIYNWVYEHIAFREYTGLRMDALSTLLTGYGNSWDTSALLAAMLRQVGVPARFVINAMNGLSGTVPVAYVEAWLPLDSYRSGDNAQTGDWVPLAPWFKLSEFNAGENLYAYPETFTGAEPDFDFETYLSVMDQKTAIERFEEQMQAYLFDNDPGASLVDVPFTERVIKTPSSILPTSLPKDLELTGSNAYFSTIPDIYKTGVTVAFERKSGQPLFEARKIYLNDIAGKRLYLDFEGDEDLNLYIPRLKLDDIVLAEGNITFPADRYYLALTYAVDGQEQTKQRPSKPAGAFAYIALDALPASENRVETLKKQLSGMTLDDYRESHTSRNKFLGIAGNILSESYFARQKSALERAAALTYCKVDWSAVNPFILYNNSVAADATSKFLVLPNWKVDAWSHIAGLYHGGSDGSMTAPQALDRDDDLYRLCDRLAGYTASYNEAAIFEDWQDTPALSTVKGLMWANENDIPVIEITRSNISTDGTDIPVLTSVAETAVVDGETIRKRLWDGTDTAQLWDEMQYGPTPNYIADIIAELTRQDGTGYAVDKILIPNQLLNFEDGISGYGMLALGPREDGYLCNMDRYGQMGDASENGGITTTEMDMDSIPLKFWPNSAISADSDIYGSGTAAAQAVEDLYLSGDVVWGTEEVAMASAIGDPVNLLTGEFFQQEKPDLHIPAPGPTEELDLTVQRTYYSRMVYNGPFGYGWSWNHDDRLVFVETDEDKDDVMDTHKILYYHGESVPYAITDNTATSGGYELPAGALFTFTKTGAGYEVHIKDKAITVYFDSEGKLTKKQDRFGNYLRFIYNGSGRLMFMQDTLGRSLSFAYNDNGKFESITDFAGNTCTYAYGTDYHYRPVCNEDGYCHGEMFKDENELNAVTDLEENVTQYEYLYDEDNPANNYNMSRYTMPNGDSLTIGYYKNDQVAYHENDKGGVFNFQYSRINKYAETWNEDGYYRKVFFDDDNNEIRVTNEDGTLIKKTYDDYHNMTSLTDGNGYATLTTGGDRYTIAYQYYPDTCTTDEERNAFAANRKLYKKEQPIPQMDGATATWTYEYAEDVSSGNRYYYAPTRVVEPDIAGISDTGTPEDITPETRFEYYLDGSLHKKIEAPGYGIQAGVAVTDSAYGKLVWEDADSIVTEYIYDSHGNIETIIDPDGNTETREYDDSGLYLTKIIDRRGKETRFTYYVGGETGKLSQKPQPIGAIKTKTDPDGNTVRFEYNRYGQVIYQTDPLGQVTAFEYNANRQLVKTTAPNGAKTINVYDTARTIESGGDLIKKTDDLGNSEWFEYDGRGNLIKKQDKNGNVYRFVYNGMNKLIEKIDPFDNATTYAYDGNGNLIKETDRRGNSTFYKYDAANRLIEKTDPKGTKTIITYDLHGNKTSEHMEYLGGAGYVEDNALITYAYDRLGRLCRKILAPDDEDYERVSEYRYNANGKLIKEITPKGHLAVYSYDENGNKTAQAAYNNNGETFTKLSETRFAYTDSGLLCLTRQVTDASNPDLGNETEYVYDEMARKAEIIDAQGNRVLFTYDAVGNLVAKTDKKGNVSMYAYDSLNRLIKEVDVMGHATTYRYDANGNQIMITDAMGHATRVYYDAMNRKTAVVAADGGRTTFDYDENGNLVCVTDPMGHSTKTDYDETNQPVLTTDAMKNKTETAYDHKGRVIKTTQKNSADAVVATIDRVYEDPIGLATQVIEAAGTDDVSYRDMAYDGNGNLEFAVDGNGIATRYVYDGLDRMVQKTEDYEGDDQATTQYGYNFAGNLVYVTDAKGSTIFYQYDELNRRIMETDAHNNAQPANPDAIIYDDYDYPAQFVAYDANGNVDLVTKRDTTQIDYVYDTLNRRTEVRVGSESDLEQDFVYDDLSRLTQSRDYNRGQETHTVVYAYDAMSRVTAETQDTRCVGKTWNLAGNLATLSYSSPSADTVARTYDANNRLTGITMGSATIASGIEYKAQSQVTGMTLGNGMTLSVTHDNRLRETEREYLYGTTVLYDHAIEGNGVDILSGYDGNNNVLRESVTYDGLSLAKIREYTYDHLDRLTDMERPNATVENSLWRYDDVGNWIQTDQNGATEYPTPNQDNEYTMSPLAYDANGNLTSDGVNTYTYDWANRLVAVYQGETLVASYEYDAANRRVEKFIDGGEQADKQIDYVYDGGHVIEEYVDGGFDRLYVYGVYVDDPVMMQIGASRYYYVKDRQQSIRALVDSSGVVKERYDYTPFGLMVVDLDDLDIDNAYGFTGRRWDAETGLWYYRNRMYSATLGRFLQRDPAGYVDGMNLYAYVRNNPLRFTDPSGLILESLPDLDNGGNLPSLDSIYMLDTISQDWINYLSDWDKLMDMISQPPTFSPTSAVGSNITGSNAVGASAIIIVVNSSNDNPLTEPTIGNVQQEVLIKVEVANQVDGVVLGPVNTDGVGQDAPESQRILLADSGFASDLPLGYGLSFDDEGLLNRAPFPLGVYRSPEEGIYNDDPIIYKNVYYETYGFYRLLNLGDGQAAIEAGSGAVLEGSTRIVVYGNEDTQTPTSWLVDRYEIGGDSRPGSVYVNGVPVDTVTGAPLCGWTRVDEITATELPITTQTISYFLFGQ